MLSFVLPFDPGRLEKMLKEKNVKLDAVAPNPSQAKGVEDDMVYVGERMSIVESSN